MHMKLTLILFLLFSATSLARSEETICHFDLETDEIGVPSCELNECIYDLNFPNYESHRISRASLKIQSGDDYIVSNLALEESGDKASSLLFFSKPHPLMQLSVYYQLEGCVGLVTYQIDKGLLKKLK